MKKLFKSFLIASAMTAVLALAACSDDDDSGSANGGPDTPTATLPASVGTNEFSGKTWKEEDSEGITTFVFTGSTLTETTTYEEDGNFVVKYRYSFDSEKKLLHLALISYTEDGETISSVSDYVASGKKWAEEDGEEWTSTMNEYYTADAKCDFSLVETYKYEINGSTLKLSDDPYFDGSLPSAAVFRNKNGSEYIKLGGGRIKLKDNNTEFYSFPTYTGGSFSGTMYKGYGEEKAGTIAGTYTTSGTGLTGSTVKITFTTLPAAITSIAKDTEYTLSQDAKEDSYRTLTLVE